MKCVRNADDLVPAQDHHDVVGMKTPTDEAMVDAVAADADATMDVAMDVVTDVDVHTGMATPSPVDDTIRIFIRPYTPCSRM